MIIKSKEDILSIATWRGPNELIFDLYSPMLDRTFKVSIDFDPNIESKEIRPYTFQSIQEFQSLKADEIPKIHDKIWEAVLKANETYKYSNDGGKTWKESTLEDNLLYMGIKSKEDAIAKSPITGIGFINELDIDHTYFTIFMNPEWDEEHGLTAYYYHGKLDYVE